MILLCLHVGCVKMDNIICTECKKEFGSEDALVQHTKIKHPKETKQSAFKLGAKQKRKIKNWSIFIVIAVLVVGSIYFFVSNIKNLPPTDPQGHSEANPLSHILKQPMSIAVQKHMLEHADGKGSPGVIINYNCIDYKCEDDLIEKLESFAKEYNHVYVAPFPNMDAKIALTKYRKIELFDTYNSNAIRLFIKRS